MVSFPESSPHILSQSPRLKETLLVEKQSSIEKQSSLGHLNTVVIFNLGAL